LEPNIELAKRLVRIAAKLLEKPTMGSLVRMGSKGVAGVLTGRKKETRGEPVWQVILPGLATYAPLSSLHEFGPGGQDGEWAEAVSTLIQRLGRMPTKQTIEKSLEHNHYALAGTNQTVEWKVDPHGEIIELKTHPQAIYF